MLGRKSSQIPSVLVPPRPFAQKDIDAARTLMRRGTIRLTDQFGFSEQLTEKVAPIPEALILGSTNVGKSSLLTALLSPRGSPPATRDKPRDYPHISRTQGFTQTLSFYTVNNLLRLVDSPGYGYKSSLRQGSVVVDFLNAYSSTLSSTYILVQAAKGLGSADTSVCELLAQLGIPFNIVLTKADILKRADAVDAQSSSISRELSQHFGALMGEVFVTSAGKKKWHNLGVDELRAAIYLSSGVKEAKSL